MAPAPALHDAVHCHAVNDARIASLHTKFDFDLCHRAAFPSAQDQMRPEDSRHNPARRTGPAIEGENRVTITRGRTAGPATTHPSIATGASRAMPRSAVRYSVLAFLFIITAINYGDRATLGIAGSSISHDLGLSPVAMGYVFSAFGWAYVINQVPGGWLLDRFGSIRVRCQPVCMVGVCVMHCGNGPCPARHRLSRAVHPVGRAGTGGSPTFPPTAASYQAGFPRLNAVLPPPSSIRPSMWRWRSSRRLWDGLPRRSGGNTSLP